MKLRVAWIGKTKDAHLAALASDFTTRIRRFMTLEITEIKDPKTGDLARQLALETEAIHAAVDDGDRVVVLDSRGKLWTSDELAEFLGSHLRGDSRRLTFVIGGYGGVGESVRKRAERIWSLSPLTFTHEMARVLVLEQLFRALAILNNHPYSK